MINQLIYSIINCERSLEKIRIRANKLTLFCLKPILERFDQENKGYITTYDLIQFCQDNEVECSLIEAFWSLKYLDVNKDGRVTIQDLAAQMLTKTNHDIRFMTAMREPYYIEKQMCLPEVIETAVVEYFKELIQFIKQQITFKMALDKERFNYFQFLQTIDVSNSGIIKFCDLKTYFKLSEEDCHYLFMQGNFNQKMEYQEFLDILIMTSKNIQTKTAYFKQVEEQQFQQQNQSESMSPDGRKTVKMQQKPFQNSGETFSNASSIFVDRIATDLQDLQLTPFKDTDNKGSAELQQNRQNYNLFLQMLLKCKEIYKVQEKLINRNDYSSKLLFELIDVNKQGYLTEQDFQRCFKRFRFQVSGQIKYLFQYYGKDQRLTFDQFLALIMPENCKKDFKIDKSVESFSNVTLDYIRQLFQDLIDMEKFKHTQIFQQHPELKHTERENLEIQISQIFNKFQTYPRPVELKLVTYYLNFAN